MEMVATTLIMIYAHYHPMYILLSVFICLYMYIVSRNRHLYSAN
jgi:hypothetical protein